MATQVWQYGYLQWRKQWKKKLLTFSTFGMSVTLWNIKKCKITLFAENNSHVNIYTGLFEYNECLDRKSFIYFSLNGRVLSKVGISFIGFPNVIITSRRCLVFTDETMLVLNEKANLLYFIRSLILKPKGLYSYYSEYETTNWICRAVTVVYFIFCFP